MVTRQTVTAGGAERTVVVERGLDDMEDARSAVARALRIGVPAVLLVVALVTWWIAGVTLGPVRAAQERQRRFVSDAAHELRSPVASMRQHAEVAVAHPETTDVRELATTVTAESVRLQAIVEDLLLLARLDEGALRLEHDEVDLDDVVLGEARRLRNGGTLAIETGAVGAGRVRGDAHYLERLVGNLGDNAAHHARARIVFALTRAGRARHPRGGRRRAGHPRARAGPGLRAFRSAGRGPGSCERRHRPRARDRPGDRARPRRRYRPRDEPARRASRRGDLCRRAVRTSDSAAAGRRRRDRR